MTAHIDETTEREFCDCDPHDCHALVKRVREVKHSRAGWIFTACVSALFNLIFIIERVLT